jgi:PPM family protein phosphatase
MTPSSLQEIDANGLSHIGPVREDNQDAIQLPDVSIPPGRGLLYALADGMGGYAHGGLASRIALENLVKTFHQEESLPVLKVLRKGVDASNLGVFQASQRLGHGRMGSTLTAAVVQGDQLFLAHVGDSRAYLIRNGKITCLTNDHTTVGDLVRGKVISPDQVRTHARRSILTRCIGLSLFVQPDLIKLALQDGDRLILCSDGAWSVIQDDEFLQLAMESSSAEEHNRRLIDLALERQTDDNASVITVHLHRLAADVARNGNGHARSLTGFLRVLWPTK